MTSFSIGPVTVYGYGLVLAAAALLALWLGRYTFRTQALRKGTLSWFAVLAVPLAVLFARLLYCLVRIWWLLDRGVETFFHLTEGGFMLYGAMFGCFAAAFLAARVTRQSVGSVCDGLAAPAALMIALSRLAEGLAGQGYGWYVDDWFDPEMGMSLFHPKDYDFVLRFPFAVQDPWYGQWRWAVFVVEALIALIILVVLLRLKDRHPGGRAMLFLLMYAAMQALGESLRQDDVMRWGFIRISQLISALAVGLVLIVSIVKMRDKKAGRIISVVAVVAMCVGVIIAMEFALEKKILFLAWMPMDVCYTVMAAACLGLIASVCQVWKRAFPKVTA